MIKSLTFSCLLIFFYGLSIPKSIGQLQSKPFEFQFENKTMRGLIEMPSHQSSSAIVMIIPGYGRTDFVEGMWFSELRQNLVAAGLTVCLWDKMGCGQSDGEFNALQPVKNSAEEALAAIEEIKKLEISGHEKIDLWGMSRAAWICPLIID